MDINVFDNPNKYIYDIVNNVRISPNNMKNLSGKTMSFVFFTKFPLFIS